MFAVCSADTLLESIQISHPHRLNYQQIRDANIREDVFRLGLSRVELSLAGRDRAEQSLKVKTAGGVSKLLVRPHDTVGTTRTPTPPRRDSARDRRLRVELDFKSLVSKARLCRSECRHGQLEYPPPARARARAPGPHPRARPAVYIPPAGSTIQCGPATLSATGASMTHDALTRIIMPPWPGPPSLRPGPRRRGRTCQPASVSDSLIIYATECSDPESESDSESDSLRPWQPGHSGRHRDRAPGDWQCNCRRVGVSHAAARSDCRGDPAAVAVTSTVAAAVGLRVGHGPRRPASESESDEAAAVAVVTSH